MPNLRFPIAIAILTFIVVALTTRDRPTTNLPTGQAMKAEIEKRLGIKLMDPDASFPINRTAAANSKMEKAFDYQLKQYQTSLNTLESNLFMQAAFVIFGVFILFSKQDTFKVPVVNLELQRSWLYFVVPLALLFLWLRFGFLLDTLIKTRVYGWELYRQLSGNSTALDLRSGAALFEDSGFLDAWFLCFRGGNEHLLNFDHKRYVWFIFPLVFGTLLALNHACIVGIAYIGNVRMQRDLKARPRLRKSLRCLPVFMFCILCASHILFYQGGRNPNWFQLVVSAMAVLILFVLVILARARGTGLSVRLPRDERGEATWEQGNLSITIKKSR